jgi:hypothetical protein
MFGQEEWCGSQRSENTASCRVIWKSSSVMNTRAHRVGLSMETTDHPHLIPARQSLWFKIPIIVLVL